MNFENRLIPNCLYKFRKLLGLEQSEVAFLLGLKSHTPVSEWETGETMPSLGNALKLSAVYKTPLDDLFYDIRMEFLPELEERMKELEAHRARYG